MRIMFFVICCCIISKSNAQTFPVAQVSSAVSCSMEQGANGLVMIYADNKTFSTYTLKMNLSGIVGFSASVSPDAILTVEPGRHEIVRLTKNAGYTPNISLRYSYSIHRGTPFRKAPDSTFSYLLPSTEATNLIGIKVNALTSELVMNAAGHVKPDVSDPKEKEAQTNHHGVGFLYHQGDTITAVRAGTVIDVIGDKQGDSKQQIFTRNRNNISVEQKDGTILNYNITAGIQPLVEAGDRIIPGQPIAVFNAQEGKYSVLLSVNYLDENKLKLSSAEKPVSPQASLPIIFFTGNSTEAINSGQLYKPVHAKEIILKELDRRQKKKLNF